MEYTAIAYEVDDRVARITLNRPKKMNAISIRLRKEFHDALAVADDDPEVRVIVVNGAGGRAFSAGFDLNDEDAEVKAGGEKQRTVNDWKKIVDDSFDFLYSPFKCSKPVIAMVNGYCLGGAMDFISMCDLRYCSDDARFGAVEVRFGQPVMMMSIPWVMGQRCRELMYTGDLFDAQEAYRLGFVNRVYPKERLEEEVIRIAKRISRVAMPTLVWHKRALNNTMNAGGFDSALRYGAEAGLIMENSDSEFKRYAQIQLNEGTAAANQWVNSIFAPFEKKDD
ncbi:enoyl-CoA hydratase/isomerase family protein [Bradyrhizobium sp. SSUT77]|uniref:enoyl-CoA hydratase/isomerase family protein n=1 Tax=Bradyrhizobium sp. SSUT77 TaxID=3040603 RepID=UPI0024482B4E|nr:enoyl-CoA hydratase/isomerase family protein [Bradyrhizobium sp. SSUT77]MDH2348664.1 enoyl-CoA hydratase/isomerase family protein [Bradyrhizobium sp. SSUT77]